MKDIQQAPQVRYAKLQYIQQPWNTFSELHLRSMCSQLHELSLGFLSGLRIEIGSLSRVPFISTNRCKTIQMYLSSVSNEKYASFYESGRFRSLFCSHKREARFVLPIVVERLERSCVCDMRSTLRSTIVVGRLRTTFSVNDERGARSGIHPGGPSCGIHPTALVSNRSVSVRTTGASCGIYPPIGTSSSVRPAAVCAARR